MFTIRSDLRTSKRGHIRIVTISTTVLAIVIVSMVVLVLGPVRSSLRTRDLERATAQTELVRGKVASFLDQAQNIATQVPSRTRVREEFVAYLQGERTLPEYREFATSKLQDAIDGSEAILAVRRLDRDGAAIVSIGFPPVRDIALDGTEARILHEVATVNDRVAFLVRAPIIDPNYGHAGWDIVAIDAEPLRRGIDDAAGSLGDAAIAVLTPDKQGVSAGTVDRDRSYRFDYGLPDQWRLEIDMPYRTVHSDTRRIVTLLVVVITVIGSLALAGNGLAIAALTRRSAEETRELAALVEERTKELRRTLDEKQVLMREIHHRIKNDMHLVQSLLSLQIEQVTGSGSGEILKDARGLISLMQRIYEHLYQQEDYGEVEIQPILARLLEEDIRTLAASAKLTITTDIQHLILPRRIAVPIGIIANELAVNSIKYGCEDASEPVISFSLHRRADHLEISMRDNGPGFPESTIHGSYGYGISMVEALVTQFHGSIRLSNNGGACVDISIPAEELERAG